MTTSKQAAVEVTQGVLSPSLCQFLLSAPANGEHDTYADGEGPEATAQRAERHGLASISAWKGAWQYRLSEAGIAARSALTRAGQSEEKAE